jgi:hypothetical protein
MRNALILLMLITLLAAPVTAKDGCDPTTPRPEDGSCDAVSEMKIIIRTPAWLSDYPNARETVMGFVSESRQSYMVSMAEEPLRDIPVPLWYEIDYEVVVYSDEIVTIVLYEYINYGGLYPVDAIYTFTFDLVEDRQITITDLLRDDARVEDVFPPIIEAVHGEGVLEDLYMADRLDDPDAYNTFTLSPDTLTLIYPTIRQGPIHAGMLSVEILLKDLESELSAEPFSD